MKIFFIVLNTIKKASIITEFKQFQGKLNQPKRMEKLSQQTILYFENPFPESLETGVTYFFFALLSK